MKVAAETFTGDDGGIRKRKDMFGGRDPACIYDIEDYIDYIDDIKSYQNDSDSVNFLPDTSGVMKP